MDFKALLNKLDSMDAPAAPIAAPELPKAVQLDESAQLRVLAGQSTILAESELMEKAKNAYAVGMAAAKKATGDEPPLKKSTIKKAHEIAKKVEKNESIEEDADMKVGDKKRSSTGGTIEKTATGIKHTAGKNYGGSEAPKDDDEDGKPAKKVSKKVKEEADMKVGDKKKSSTGGTIEKTKTGIKHTAGKNYSGKSAEKEDKKVKEAAKPDFLDMDKDGDKKEPMKKAVADKKKGAVKESVEGTLTFAKALQIIKESNGTAQIDPLDENLWRWARRVAESKFTESVKVDVYAATTYERMGGTWGIAQINE